MAHMKRPSILVVLGNRPQFIKHAAMQRAWNSRLPDADMVVVDTGQHYDYALAGIFMDELAITQPQHELSVGSASHAEQLARIIVPLEELVTTLKPASVVVYGDTNSTLGGMLVAAKLNVPVAHIEAGLRSRDMSMPEELNRVLVDHASSLLFCPTAAAVENLEREGIAGEHVRLVGDVMADVALAIAPAADRRWPGLQEQLGLPETGTFALATIHRAANTEPEALGEIIECLRAADAPILLPLHPRTEAMVERSGLHLELASLPNVTLLPPLSYTDLAATLRAARCALTDSGGLQKEAYIHGIPCVTLRDTTEWTETIDAGLNVLVARNPAATAAAVAEAFSGTLDSRLATRPDLYGDGHAADRIVDALIEHATHRTHFAL